MAPSVLSLGAYLDRRRIPLVVAGYLRLCVRVTWGIIVFGNEINALDDRFQGKVATDIRDSLTGLLSGTESGGRGPEHSDAGLG